jgi:hypothetical protein
VSRGPILLGAVLAGPPTLAAIFVDLFHWIQRTFDPAGSLEAIDMTPYARRDEAMVVGFGLLLLALVGACAWQARSMSDRVAVLLAGLAMVAVTFLGTFFALVAP